MCNQLMPRATRGEFAEDLKCVTRNEFQASELGMLYLMRDQGNYDFPAR
jgi:hypothetical protein